MAALSTPTLSRRPDRIFVSVDERTGRSTVSFFPADVGPPFQFEDDRTGAQAMTEAKRLAGTSGCTVEGPHFHASSATPRKRRRP